MSIISSPKLPSERNFGLLFAAVFVILGIRGATKHWNWIAYGGCLMAGSAFGLFALTNPRILGPLNKAWFYLGKWLGKITSPIVMGIIFFVILTPVSILTRLFGRDELRLKRRAINSYWIDRASPDVTAQSFKNQF
ncbi:MAG TPA: SxtJ family membrane protein [Candidatus Angelobacter sp.]|nr:SxtJ family membrane protein [Candidatus Angelobacter sp.]